MTDAELIAVRTDLHERGYPADDWSDAEIEDLPRWVYGPGWMFATLRDGAGELGDIIVDALNVWRKGESQCGNTYYSRHEAIEHVEDNRPCNRLAILDLLEQEAATCQQE